MTTSPKQNLILFQLAFLGPVKASDLKPPAERNALAKAGWIESRKAGRATIYDLTDKGWAGLDQMDVIKLPKTQAASLLFEKFFALTQRRLHARAESLASLLVDGSSDPEPVRPESVSLPQRIRETYLRLSAASPGCEVRLKHLKAELAGTDPETLDLCLLGLVMAGKGQLRQIDDPLALDPDDWSAAIDLGGTARHLYRSLS